MFLFIYLPQLLLLLLSLLLLLFSGDGNVTESEFVELWIALTGQTTALAQAYFHLADLTDDKIINQNDYGLLYRVFDLNSKFGVLLLLLLFIQHFNQG